MVIKYAVLTLFFILLIFSFKLLPEPKKELSTKPTLIDVQGKMKVKYPQYFTIVLVGDSMTEYLGNSDELRAYLKEYYPGKSFEVLNYGFGSTNILSLQERLEQKTFHSREFRPITEIDFDLIIIESFGHNPLSEFALPEGLQKQTEALKKSVQIIKQENPQAKIIFLATLGPNKKVYAYRAVDLTDEKRAEWANERIAYIKNHIEFAKSNDISIINVFEKALDKDGDTNRDYISDTDYIHPSPKGIIFISHQIADFIFQNSIF